MSFFSAIFRAAGCRGLWPNRWRRSQPPPEELAASDIEIEVFAQWIPYRKKSL